MDEGVGLGFEERCEEWRLFAWLGPDAVEAAAARIGGGRRWAELAWVELSGDEEYGVAAFLFRERDRIACRGGEEDLFLYRGERFTKPLAESC